MIRTALVACAAFSLMSAASAQTYAPQQFSFMTFGYSSPNYENINGNFSVSMVGIDNGLLTVTPGIDTIVDLYGPIQASYIFLPSDVFGGQPGITGGNAGSNLWISYQGNFLGSKDFFLPYTLDGTKPQKAYPVFGIGTPLDYKLGNGQTLTITPTEENGNVVGTAHLSAPLPEFSSAAGFGLLLLGGALSMIARRRHTS